MISSNTNNTLAVKPRLYLHSKTKLKEQTGGNPMSIDVLPSNEWLGCTWTVALKRICTHKFWSVGSWWLELSIRCNHHRDHHGHGHKTPDSNPLGMIVTTSSCCLTYLLTYLPCARRVQHSDLAKLPVSHIHAWQLRVSCRIVIMHPFQH